MYAILVPSFWRFRVDGRERLEYATYGSVCFRKRFGKQTKKNTLHI